MRMFQSRIVRLTVNRRAMAAAYVALMMRKGNQLFRAHISPVSGPFWGGMSRRERPTKTAPGPRFRWLLLRFKGAGLLE
jgi:hypothetical protein